MQGTCSGAMLMLREPWSCYQSDYRYRQVYEQKRTDLFVAKNESFESFVQRYPNYVVSQLGDAKSHEKCRKYSKEHSYIWACLMNEGYYRGEEIVHNIIQDLRRRYISVGLTHRLEESIRLFEYFFPSSSCDKNMTTRVINLNKHEEVDKTSSMYIKLYEYFKWDQLLYQEVEALFEEQLVEARKIPELASVIE
jgi:hypothetical protein